MIEVRQISTKSNDFKNIKRVYNTVFPQNELLPLSLLKMRAKAGKAEFCSIYNEEGKWVGFFYTVYNKRIAYIFFLAIDPHYHGQGLGSATLTAIKERYAEKRITLSAERPDPQAPITNSDSDDIVFTLKMVLSKRVFIPLKRIMKNLIS